VGKGPWPKKGRHISGTNIEKEKVCIIGRPGERKEIGREVGYTGGMRREGRE